MKPLLRFGKGSSTRPLVSVKKKRKHGLERSDHNFDVPELVATDRRMPVPRRRRDALYLGTNLANGKPLFLKKSIQGHGVIFGRTGTGKSFALKIILEQMLGTSSLLLFDPKGSTARDLLDLLIQYPHLAADTIYFDINDTQNIIGYNPFIQHKDVPISTQIELIMGCILDVMEAESYSQTPRLFRWLSVTIELCILMELTWTEAYHILSLTESDKREAILNKAEDMGVASFLGYKDLNWLRKLKSPQVMETQVESSHNRLIRILRDEHIRTILSQKKSLDLVSIMNEGKTLIVNAERGRSKEGSTLLIKMMSTQAAHFATLPSVRPRDGSVSDCYIVIEEFAEVLTRSVGQCLHLTREFGVWFLLVAQYLGQIENFDEDLLESVFTNTDLKIVFGGMDPKNLDRLADVMFLGQYNLKAVKHTRRVYDIKQGWVNVESRGESQGKNQSVSHSITESESEAKSKSEGRNWSNTHSMSSGQSEQTGENQSEGVNDTETRSASKTSGTSLARSHTEGGGVGFAVSNSESEGTSHADSSAHGSTYGESTPLYRDGRITVNEAISFNEGSTDTVNKSVSVTKVYSTSDNWSDGETRTESESKTEGESFATGMSKTTGVSSGKGRSSTQGLAHMRGGSINEGATHTTGVADTSGKTNGTSETRSRTITPQWLTRHIPREEVASFWSLAELKHIAMALLYTLPKAHAVIRYHGVTVPVRIKYVKPPKVRVLIREWFLKRIMQHSFVQTAEEAQRHIDEHEARLYGPSAKDQIDENTSKDDLSGFFGGV